jgi:hypothetical protein
MIHGGTEAYFHSFLKSTLDEVVNFTLQPPYPQGKKPLYPLDSRVGEPEGRSGPVGEEVNLLQYVNN